MSSDSPSDRGLVDLSVVTSRVTGIDINTGIVILANSSIVANDIIIKMSAAAHHIRVVFVVEMLNTSEVKIVTGFIKIDVRCTNHGRVHNCMNGCRNNDLTTTFGRNRTDIRIKIVAAAGIHSRCKGTKQRRTHTDCKKQGNKTLTRRFHNQFSYIE